MGQPVVHFEIVGKDGDALRSYYGELFGWTIDANNPMNYGIVAREDNLNADGIGIGGGLSGAMEGMPGYVTVYVEVPDVEAALVKATELGGTRLMGPEQITPDVQIGLFNDPQGNMIGLLKGAS